MSVARTHRTPATAWTSGEVTVDAGDGTVSLASSDPQRQDVTIINDADSSGDVFLVPAGGQRSGGIRVAPGAGFTLDTSAEVYGYVKTGSAVLYVVQTTGIPC